MKNLYFISSPLHLFIAANYSLMHRGERSVAVIISKSQSLAESLTRAVQANPAGFSEQICMPEIQQGGKLRHRKSMMMALENLINDVKPEQILTGNDRRFEFQYAMHYTSTHYSTPQAVYLDDGLVSYVGHKSRFNFSHRYIDPFLKKCVYGNWWKNAETTGTSDWIDEAHLAFPEFADPALRAKSITAIDRDGFLDPYFQSLSKFFLKENRLDSNQIHSLDCVLCLPADGEFVKSKAVYKNFFDIQSKKGNPYRIAIKPHPRTTHLTEMANLFPSAEILDPKIGFEMLLPIFKAEMEMFGNTSTTLLTAKWLRPDIRVVSLSKAEGGALPELLKGIGVEFLE